MRVELEFNWSVGIQRERPVYGCGDLCVSISQRVTGGCVWKDILGLETPSLSHAVLTTRTVGDAPIGGPRPKSTVSDSTIIVTNLYHQVSHRLLIHPWVRLCVARGLGSDCWSAYCKPIE